MGRTLLRVRQARTAQRYWSVLLAAPVVLSACGGNTVQDNSANAGGGSVVVDAGSGAASSALDAPIEAAVSSGGGRWRTGRHDRRQLTGYRLG